MGLNGSRGYIPDDRGDSLRNTEVGNLEKREGEFTGIVVSTGGKKEGSCLLVLNDRDQGSCGVETLMSNE